MDFFKCAGVSKVFNEKVILDNLSLTVREHEIISIIGPSGAGKTTLLRCIAGLEPVDNGTITLKGQDITGLQAEKRPIVMMFQQPLLFPHLTVLENIIYGLKARGEHRQQTLQAGREMLAKIELTAREKSYPFELSWGQQQRVALARALIMQPQILLLDEPLASLDPELRFAFRNWIRQLLRENGVTALLVTHDKEEAMIMGDRIAVVAQGIVQQTGNPFEVYRQPANPFVAEFFAEGILLAEDRFIPVDKLAILAPDPDQPQESTRYEYHFSGIVQDKWVKSGMFMYRIRLSAREAEFIYPSRQVFNIGDLLTVGFDNKDVHLMEG
ncbi:MAG TPA: ABC transporter ATP-binding protein [Bacillota bacterium]|nr:ABC transporter ATP-binding protein [Bacillota bacterium]